MAKVKDCWSFYTKTMNEVMVNVNDLFLLVYDHSLYRTCVHLGNLKQLLSFSNLFPKELGSFISSHSHLSWLHYLATEEYNEV